MSLEIDHDIEDANERFDLDEIAFWGIHSFYENPYSLGCTRCGWGFHDVLHDGTVNEYPY